MDEQDILRVINGREIDASDLWKKLCRTQPDAFIV